MKGMYKVDFFIMDTDSKTDNRPLSEERCF